MDKNWNLTGHEWAVDLLRRHVAEGQARHAYLITGPEGVGRRTLAARFAQALNCTEPPAPGEYCGKCPNCKQTSVMRHADLVITTPLFKDGSLGVDQVRDAQLLLTRHPLLGKYRLSLFPGFQAATPQAQNAMLKTLEEAPAHAVIVLTAEEPEQLLPTIVSRCEVLRLKPVGVSRVEALLRDSGVEPEKAHLFAHLSEGRPGLAKRLLEDERLLAERRQRLDELKAMLTGSRVDKFAYADSLSKAKCSDVHVDERIQLTGQEQNQLDGVKRRCVLRNTYPIWLSFWRDVLVRTSGADIPLTNIDYEDLIHALAAQMDLPAARRVVADMELGIRRLEDNLNTRLLTEVLLLDWPRL